MPEPRQILSGSARNAAAGARLIGKTDDATQISVTVVLKRKRDIERADLHRHALLKPHERPITDHAAFAEQYGAGSEAIDAIRAFAAAHGLTVTNVDQLRRVIELSGTVANMEQAFGTLLHDYATGRTTYRGRRGPLLLPPEIIPHVEAVLGLDNRPVAKPRLRSRNVQASYYPQELAALYNFPRGDGAGQTVALIELGGNYGQQDLQTYFAASGLTQAPTVRSISVSQNVPIPYGQDPRSDGEVMLDIEVVGAMAPGATTVVYFAENTDQGFYQAASRAVHDPATTAVSISWGSPEKDWSAQSMDAWNSLGQSAILLNVPIFVAAGDHGCTDEQTTDDGYDGQRHVDFPGSCANVASCGGTSLQSRGTVITNETVWNDNNGWATGGGVSTHFQNPAWQSGLMAESNAPLLMRGVPDVSGNADPDTGINVRVNGNDGVSGGTSAVAPQWAALTAVLSQSLRRKAGFFIPLLYANSKAATNDIAIGSNSVFGVTGFSAKPGWDACTGLGSPNGAKLLALLSSPGIPAVEDAPSSAAGPQPDAGTVVAASPQLSVGQAKAAVLYGQFVQAAYSMYNAAPNNLTPPPSSDFPADYDLVAWVQMQDFIIGSTGPTFYGFIAQGAADPNRFVLAIRGTSNAVEWWDDVNAALLIPFKVPGCGSVGAGFARIYDTLEVVERPTGPATAEIVPQSLRAIGGFSQQVANLVARHAPATARAPGFAASASIEVTGHSLGAALATLYTLENADTGKIKNPALCTFASPAVGDSTFAAAFNGLGLTSWRVVNAPDLVPKLPPQILGFRHVDSLQQYSSTGTVRPSLLCWHSVATYLSLLDPTLQPDLFCRLPISIRDVRLAAASRPTVATTLSVPARPASAMWPNFDGKPYTREQLATHINACDFSTWKRKDGSRGKPAFITLHNTSSPTIQLWLSWSPEKRQQYILNLQPYYARMGWRGGPHFFVTPQNDICAFGFNDLMAAGTHASCFNNVSIGIEMVGEFDNEAFASGPGARVADNAIYLMALLHNKIGITPAPYVYDQRGLHFHVECKADNHDCPGRFVVKSDVVARVTAKMAELIAPAPAALALNEAILETETAIATTTDIFPQEAVDRICNLAAASNIAFYEWKNRGRAPLGYTKGMAVVFGLVYGKLKRGNAAASAMAAANVNASSEDALSWYQARFAAAGMSNATPGPDTLRHLFVLLMGLGMRESSGRYCEGRDTSEDNTTADTAEAGLFQMSWNAHLASPYIGQLFSDYSSNPDGFLSIFQEGVTCTHLDYADYGDGEGNDFQQLCKSCPAFAVEAAAVGLRVLRTHWGPLNSRAAEVRPEADALLRQVQAIVDSYVEA